MTMSATVQPDFLPVTRAEMARIGWRELDVLLITGDAYVDHPAFGAALLGRLLGSRGFRVGIVAQPRWTAVTGIAAMGPPRLCVGITAGCLDSMLAHFTAFRKRRRNDAHTPGGAAGARPNRAVLVYAALARQAFPGTPVILGGIEASMRRATHYDFWADSLRRSVLLDAKADLLVYGMGERALLEACERLRAAAAPSYAAARECLRGIRGTAYVLNPGDGPAAGPDPELRLPAHAEILDRPAALMEATLKIERQVHSGTTAAVQACGDRLVVFMPPAPALTPAELDDLYGLPFSRREHPSGGAPVPALKTVQFSITTHRGCAGGCSFCSLALHQGRRIASRSAPSILAEVDRLARHDAWRGSITDVGGPTANMWGAVCDADPAACSRPSCLVPDICPHFVCSQTRITNLLTAISRRPGVSHVRVASGIRHDLALRDPAYVRALVDSFVGGQLKLAPEHRSELVLRLMRKPGFEKFEEFLARFRRISRGTGKEQYTVPYLISAFPGCAANDMRRLRQWLDRRRWRPQQVQCFIPTPGTVATAMFHAGIDPEGRPIYVARTDAERLRQHRILVGGPGPASASGRGRRARKIARAGNGELRGRRS